MVSRSAGIADDRGRVVDLKVDSSQVRLLETVSLLESKIEDTPLKFDGPSVSLAARLLVPDSRLSIPLHLDP